ncbi:MAG: hypothetical protein QM564_12645 [Bergeyella sp.]
MNLNNLKELYNQEEITETPEISLEKKKEIHLPLEKIRKNMRMEFWSNFPAMLLLFLFITPLNTYFSGTTKELFAVFLVTFCFIIFYYNYRFYKFYKRMPDISKATRESLSELLFDLRLNTELYKSYYIAVVPLVLSECVILLYPMHHFSMVSFIIIFVLMCVFIVFFGRGWYQYFYGRHVKKLEKMIEDLK